MIDENINADVDDVVNYIKATKYAIDRFGKLGILHLVKKQGRNKVYTYKEYIDILKNGTEVLM